MRALALAIVLVLIAVLLVVVPIIEVPRIEAKINQSADTALRDGGHDWASTQTNDQTVTISGIVVSEAERQAAPRSGSAAARHRGG